MILLILYTHQTKNECSFYMLGGLYVREKKILFTFFSCTYFVAFNNTEMTISPVDLYSSLIHLTAQTGRVWLASRVIPAAAHRYKTPTRSIPLLTLFTQKLNTNFTFILQWSSFSEADYFLCSFKMSLMKLFFRRNFNFCNVYFWSPFTERWTSVVVAC